MCAVFVSFLSYLAFNIRFKHRQHVQPATEVQRAMEVQPQPADAMEVQTTAVVQPTMESQSTMEFQPIGATMEELPAVSTNANTELIPSNDDVATKVPTTTDGDVELLPPGSIDSAVVESTTTQGALLVVEPIAYDSEEGVASQ